MESQEGDGCDVPSLPLASTASSVVVEEFGPLLFLFGFGFWGCDTARGPFREIALAAAVDVHVDLL